MLFFWCFLFWPYYLNPFRHDFSRLLAAANLRQRITYAEEVGSLFPFLNSAALLDP